MYKTGKVQNAKIKYWFLCMKLQEEWEMGQNPPKFHGTKSLYIIYYNNYNNCSNQ